MAQESVEPGNGTPPVDAGSSELSEGSDSNLPGTSGRSVENGHENNSGDIQEYGPGPSVVDSGSTSELGDVVTPLPSLAFLTLGSDIIEDDDVEGAIKIVEEALFQALSQDMALQTALTSLHWLLVKRACYYYAQAVLADDMKADDMLIKLVAEPARAMRSREALVKKLETTLLELVDKMFPDDAQKVLVMQRLTRE